MNKKLVSFVCCPAVVGSCSGLVGSAINEEVPNFIVYTSDNSAFHSDDVDDVIYLINGINRQRRKINELLALDKKYGPFVAFGDCFCLSDLAKCPSKYLLNISIMSSEWIKSIALRANEAIKDLQKKIENKNKEKEKIFKELKGSLSKSSEVLEELSKGNIFEKSPLGICVEHFYTLVPRYKKLKKDLEKKKNLEKQEN